MAVFVGMPKLGMNMTRGTIVEWLVTEGDAIQAGQPLLVVETDKVVQEVEAPASGILAKIVKRADDDVLCMTVIAVIAEPGEAVPAEIPEMIPDGVRPKSDVEVVVSEEEKGTSPEGATPRRRERVKISPVARKLARELDVDISKIVPSGKRITKEEVEAAYQAQQAAAKAAESAALEPIPAPAVDEPVSKGVIRVKPFAGVRRTIAERVNRSARTVARVGLTLEADASALVAWRERLKQSDNNVGYNELLAKLVAHALQEFPYMNSQLVDNEIHEMIDINIGIATDTDRGLLVPVVHNANTKDVLEIHRELAELVERARVGKSTLEDLSGGTFTITNLGMYEIEQFLPVINLPECAILGVGAIIRRPVVVDDQIEIRPRMAITLSFDHRLVDGAPAARFLQKVKHLIETPLKLVN